MGRYIQGPTMGKADHIVSTLGGQKIPKPATFDEVPKDKALIVVVNNTLFDAAGWAYSAAEFDAFTQPTDPRFKEYVLVDKEIAEQNAV